MEETRERHSYTPVPIVFNEDDHYDFRSHPNNILVALSRGASRGFYDAGRNNYRDGYQSPLVEWGINTDRKREFFEYCEYITRESPN